MFVYHYLFKFYAFVYYANIIIEFVIALHLYEVNIKVSLNANFINVW